MKKGEIRRISRLVIWISFSHFRPTRGFRRKRLYARRLEPEVSSLSVLTKVQGVPLVVFDDELSCSPKRVMHVLHQGNSVFLQAERRSCHIAGLKIEVEMFTLIDKLDRRILLVYEFQVK